MIVSLRGTSGSGKSTIVQQLIGEREPIFELGQLVGHQCPGFRVIGPYPDDFKLAAGVDILNRTRRRRIELFGQIERWASVGNLIYEGLLIANEVGRTVELAKKFPTTIIFLTTPLEVCLKRVNSRRARKTYNSGSLFGEAAADQVNPKKTTEKFSELQRVASRLVVQGVAVERLDCDAALIRCRELLK